MSCRVARVSGDIGEAPLLLEGPLGLFGIDQRAAVGDPIGFEADEHHRLPLASLRGVDGRQLDRGRWIAKGRDPRPRRVVGGDEGVEVARSRRSSRAAHRARRDRRRRGDPMRGCRVTSRGRSEASRRTWKGCSGVSMPRASSISATTRSDSTMGGIAVVWRTPAWTSASRIGVSSPRVRDRKQRLRPAAPSTAARRATPSAQLGSAVFQAVIAAPVEVAPAGARIGLVNRSRLTATIRAEAATTDGGHR